MWNPQPLPPVILDGEHCQVESRLPEAIEKIIPTTDTNPIVVSSSEEFVTLSIQARDDDSRWNFFKKGPYDFAIFNPMLMVRHPTPTVERFDMATMTVPGGAISVQDTVLVPALYMSQQGHGTSSAHFAEKDWIVVEDAHNPDEVEDAFFIPGLTPALKTGIPLRYAQEHTVHETAALYHTLTRLKRIAPNLGHVGVSQIAALTTRISILSERDRVTI